ncbi:cytochrome P450 [Mycobacterium colombiense]|uniref:cytochrome P450 n=1 Tax=Mycobacterium colombiense TaxID=339268 RepID=UPI00096D4CAE|nr:cytochrome P450 [Mycobacterium colombiense]OMB93659.1 cytochrome P450 [Mycobacterium colombiense]OMC26807.1 cytochrome P450 [Mycobacterium colombiense]OMC29103.1 cytochrome P450 [Mycobacterium colombiense]
MSIAEPVRDVAALPLAPKNPLPYRERLKAIKEFHTGTNKLRDAGGPVTRVTLGPKWLIPPIVLATSPQGIRDIVSVRDGSVDKTSTVATELRRLLGANLFVLPHSEWLPRRRTLQPVFTRQRVRQFGGHMAEAAQIVCAQWRDGAEIDLDAQCRTLTLRALGRSVLGLDLDERSDAIAEPLRVATSYAVRRALRPLRAPEWMPTPARRRARAAAAAIRELAEEILQACRADPGREAPLVHALIAATDPETGQSLSDNEIRDEMIIFLFAGHDTTATTLTYALWALGRHPDLQQRVAAEAAGLPNRQLTPDDVARLGFTVRVLQEALRLCPPGPTGTRMATRDVEVAGYRVKAGTMLAFGRMAVQTDPGLWDDTLRFDPDRFSPERADGRDRWQYVPFGGGPRSCIGDHFAMLEATLALATIVRRVEIESLSEEFPLAVPFTMVAAAPIRAKIRLRE